MMSLRERKLAEVQKMCKDAGQNMFNLALSAKNSGEVSTKLRPLERICLVIIILRWYIAPSFLSFWILHVLCCD